MGVDPLEVTWFGSRRCVSCGFTLPLVILSHFVRSMTWNREEVDVLKPRLGKRRWLTERENIMLLTVGDPWKRHVWTTL